MHIKSNIFKFTNYLNICGKTKNTKVEKGLETAALAQAKIQAAAVRFSFLFS